MRYSSVFILLLACSSESSTTKPTSSSVSGSTTTTSSSANGGTTTTSSSGGATTGSGGSSPTATATSTSSGTGAGGSGGAAGPVRFVAIGDAGKGNTGQKTVADAISAFCAKNGCDFVQLLGDNIYDSGVSSVDDPLWQTKFETPYAGVNLPFWAVLGNHDYGGNGAGNEFKKGQHEIDYTKKSTKWKMPSAYYHRTASNVEIIGLDTNMQMFSQDAAQKTEVAKWISESTQKWKIAFGHHPILSNGPHGNAGIYEGIPFVPVVSGAGVKSFMDSVICGKVDFYICGHDHSRQWLKDTCKGTELAVSGGGASTTELKGKNPTYFQSDTIGFFYVVIDGNKLTGSFVDGSGKVEFTRTLTK